MAGWLEDEDPPPPLARSCTNHSVGPPLPQGESGVAWRPKLFHLGHAWHTTLG